MKIEIKCEGCGEIHVIGRTPEIPENVTHLSCNWCPLCEDQAEGYYTETYQFDKPPDKVDPVDPSQLTIEL